VVDGVNREYQLDEDYRVAHHSDAVMPRKAHHAVPHVVDVPDAHSAVLVFEKNGLRILAFQVDHRPIVPAYGYRVEYQGRAVVISGDTSYSENLVRQSKDADLLIHDAMAKDLVTQAAGLEMIGQSRTAKLLHDILTYHASTLDAASEAHVDTLVLSHLIPVPSNVGGEAAFLKGVADVFHGKVLVARDGMRFDFEAKK
jgi:ribonuclease Z